MGKKEISQFISESNDTFYSKELSAYTTGCNKNNNATNRCKKLTIDKNLSEKYFCKNKDLWISIFAEIRLEKMANFVYFEFCTNKKERWPLFHEK